MPYRRGGGHHEVSPSVLALSHRVYMLEHNRVMNVSNKDWIHVNRFIQSALPKGSSQDRISEVVG